MQIFNATIDAPPTRYSIREGILIYNQHDLKMIWFRLLALMLVFFTTVPMFTYSLSNLLAISSQSPLDVTYSLFKATSMTFVFYTLTVVSVRNARLLSYHLLLRMSFLADLRGRVHQYRDAAGSGRQLVVLVEFGHENSIWSDAKIQFLNLMSFLIKICTAIFISGQ